MPVKLPDLIPVIGAAHPLANKAKRNPEKYLPDLRTIVTHDTSVVDITRSAGITSDGKQLFVQNSEHKLAAIMAGIGVGHLSRRTVQSLLTSGKLLPLELTGTVNQACFTAWKLSNKGKGLKALTTILGRELKE